MRLSLISPPRGIALPDCRPGLPRASARTPVPPHQSVQGPETESVSMHAAQERAEFDTGESYFHDVRPLLEHVFSRVRREEFRFEAETDGISEPDNPEYDQRFATVYNGNGWLCDRNLLCCTIRGG